MIRWKPKVICLKKIKMSFILTDMAYDLWKVREIGWKELPANWANGGILFLQNDGVLSCTEFLIENYFTHVYLKIERIGGSECLLGYMEKVKEERGAIVEGLG